MSTVLLPAIFQRSSAFVIFAFGLYLVVAHTALTALATQRGSLQPRARSLAPWLVGGYLAIWLAAALVTGDGSNFPLARPELRRPLSLVVGFGPMLLAVALLGASKTLRELNASMRPEWLIWVQTYRVAGLMFLFPFLYFGLVPAAFAVPAAVGDLLTGLAAPFVGSAVARRRPGALAWATAWNLFGIADLIVAPTAAIISGAQVIWLYPLVLVPLFVGPPLGILTHIYSLRNLATATHREGSRRSATAAEPLGAATWNPTRHDLDCVFSSGHPRPVRRKPMAEPWKYLPLSACPHGGGLPARLQSDQERCQACGLEADLRICLTCGYVGCCESHAAHDTEHYRQTGHPWIRPQGADYDFLWCYACNAFLEPKTVKPTEKLA